jgi:hypothetical protein
MRVTSVVLLSRQLTVQLAQFVNIWRVRIVRPTRDWAKKAAAFVRPEPEKNLANKIKVDLHQGMMQRPVAPELDSVSKHTNLVQLLALRQFLQVVRVFGPILSISPASI